MWINRLSLLWCLLFFAAASEHEEDLFELNIIHYNDFHAQFEELSPTGGVCNPSVAPCIGGFARLYSAVRQAREAEPNSLLFNSGDTFQGTIWYNFLRWNVTQHFMNLLPHDAHVLGNHEFDHGVEGLLPYLELLRSPMLGANVNTTFEKELGQHVKNHVVVVKNGRRIGIIGILLRLFSAPIGGVIMEDELAAVRREAALLTAAEVDIIVVLSHVGYDTDLRLAALMPPEVDIIVGAHSHTLLFDGPTPDGSSAAGPYPTVVTQPSGHRILVVQAACCTRYLGNIKLFFDKKGIVQKWKRSPIYLGTSIVQDPDMLRELEPWRAQVDEVGKEVLGSTRVQLARAACRRRECSLGSWACDAFLEELIPRANSSTWTDGQVCLINAGGLRSLINPGEVTTEAVLMSFPFENQVEVYDLEGRYLLEALEFSVGVAVPDPNDFNSGRMLQIGGMRNVYNVSAAAGARVAASVRCAACAVPRYEPLAPAATYRVVTQDYIGHGGGGFTMLSSHRRNVVSLGVDYELLQRAVRRHRTILQGLDGRIQIAH